MGIDEFTNAAHEDRLNPDGWFKGNGKKRVFVAHDCALDYFRVHPHIITEYVPGRGTPSMFIGKYWLRDGEGVIRTELEQTGKITPFQIRSAIDSLCNMTRIVEPELIDMPLDEAYRLPNDVIPIKEGMLNLKDKTLSPHTPDYFYTEYIPRQYIPRAVPESFIAFLDKMFTGDPNAKIKITHIFETIAWTFMKDYKIQGAVIMFGSGGEGKSIIHDIFEKLLVHTSALSLDELENEKFKRKQLSGSWANLISESSTKMISSEMFKRVTDGTVITVEDKNRPPFKMRSHAKMIIDTNELPIKDDELRAFYRRVIAIIDFPNMLEDVMSPKEIDAAISILESDEELDKLFSYVVDNFYGPLVENMKFTNQLSNQESKKLWEERSNPALAYLRRRDNAGDIIRDVEDAKTTLTDAGKEINLYISKESGTFDEYVSTPKQEVINDAIKWATEKGFPGKNINSGGLGKALNSLGYQNITVDKKIGKGVKIKSWKDVFIVSWTPVPEAVSDRENSPRPPENQSTTGSRATGTGVSSIPRTTIKKETGIYGVEEDVRDHNKSNQQFKGNETVSGDSGQPETGSGPDNKESHREPENSDTTNENSKNSDVEQEEKFTAKIVNVPEEVKAEAISILDRKLLSDPKSVTCEKSNVARILSEFMTQDQIYTLLKVLYDNGKIEDNGMKWNRKLLFYKSTSEYAGKYVEAFMHKNYHYYQISMLSVDDGSKNWITWLNSAMAVSQKEFETMSSAGTMLRTMLYYCIFVPLRAYLDRGGKNE